MKLVMNDYLKLNDCSFLFLLVKIDLLKWNFDQFLNRNQDQNHLDDRERIYIKHPDDSKSISTKNIVFFSQRKTILFTLQHNANALNGFNVRSEEFDRAPIASRNFIYNCRCIVDSLSRRTVSVLGGKSV